MSTRDNIARLRAEIEQVALDRADTNAAGSPADGEDAAPSKALTPAAKRALEEAEQRRQAEEAQRKAAEAQRPKEINGRSGPDPVRYGDWENGGICSDF